MTDTDVRVEGEQETVAQGGSTEQVQPQCNHSRVVPLKQAIRATAAKTQCTI